MENSCEIQVENLRLERLERQIDELAKHSVDWRFVIATLVPVCLAMGGGLINLAISVNTLGERINSMNQSMQVSNSYTKESFDIIYKRLDNLERRGKNVTE